MSSKHATPQDAASVRWTEDVSVRAELAASYADFEKSLTPMQALRIYWKAVLWIMYGQMIVFGYGIDGVIAGALASIPRFRIDYGTKFDTGTNVDYILPATWMSIWAGVSQITAIIGAYGCGYLCEKIGRRYTNLLSCIISIGGCLAQYLSNGSMPIITAGKAINGFSIGSWVIIAPLYAAEVAPLSLRGPLVASTNFVLFCALLAFNGVIYALGPVESTTSYKIPLALQFLVPAIICVTVWFWPESPVWLARFGRREEARRAIQRLYGPSTAIDHEGLLAQIEETVHQENAGGDNNGEASPESENRGYLECFNRQNRKRTMIATGVFTFVQASGGVFVLGYQSYFYQLIGFSTRYSFLLSMLNNAVMFVATILSWGAVIWLGCRPLIVWGEFITAICLLLVGGLSVVGTVPAYKAVIAMIFVWSFVFQLTIGTLGYTVTAEIPSVRLRARTQAIANSSLSLIQWVIGFSFPYLFNPDAANLGGQVGFLYGGMTMLGFIFTFFLLPETRGRSASDIDELFERGTSPRHFTSVTLDNDVHRLAKADVDIPLGDRKDTGDRQE